MGVGCWLVFVGRVVSGKEWDRRGLVVGCFVFMREGGGGWRLFGMV